MKKFINVTENTSFAALKGMVPDASTQRTPKGEILVSDPEQEILISIAEGSGTVTVFKSGFFAYANESGRVTARAVHNCSTMYFPTAFGSFETVAEEVYGNLPFAVVLAHFGE